MKHIDIKELTANAEYVEKQVTVCGWVRTARDSKNMAFLEINDGTTLNHLQIVVDKNVVDMPAEAAALGCALRITGTAVKAFKGDGVEINADSVELLGKSGADYPLQKKFQKLETLREIPHIRLRTNTFNAVFRLRSVMAQTIHRYFGDRNYVYVNTPIVTGSDCEGAGEVFKITTIGYSDKYKSEEEYYKNDFFGQKAGLSVSGQLEGEVAATALGKIYTFGPSFRAENSNTVRHVAEFWHIEPEIAFAELPEILEIAEDMIKYIIRDVMEKCPNELKFFDERVEKGLIEKLQAVVDTEFAVIEYTEAIEILKKSGKEFTYPVEWGNDLQTEHERYITEEVLKKPVFVVNYPKGIKSFYMKQNSDGKTVAAADLLVPGVGEIIGGSERESDYDKLISAMKAKNMNLDEYSDYLDLRKYGTVPHGGFGLGFERLIMYVTGMTNIRDVILYPRTVGSIR